MKVRKKMLACAVLGATCLPGLSMAAGTDDLEASMMLMEESVEDLRKDLANRVRVSGYTDIEYSINSKAGSEPGFRMHHLSLFFQKQINEKWRFFSEIEYEDAPLFELEESTVTHPSDSSSESVVKGDAYGKIFVEAVNMDFMWRPDMMFRVGRFFTPAGIWSVDHYPPFVTTQKRPNHIRKIFPQTVDGAMAYGTLQYGSYFLKYDAYLGNGEGNTAHHDANSEKAVGFKGSLQLPFLQHAELGSTVYLDPKDTSNANASKSAYGVHAKLRVGGLEMQTEAAYARFENGTTPIGSRSGFYVQGSYTMGQWLAGYRYDDYYPDRGVTDGKVKTNSLFVNYRYSPNLVLKLEHHMVDDKGTEHQETIGSVVAYLE